MYIKSEAPTPLIQEIGESSSGVKVFCKCDKLCVTALLFTARNRR